MSRDAARSSISGSSAGHQYDLLSQKSTMLHSFNQMFDLVLILNEDRRIIFANKKYLQEAETDMDTAFGLRPGESLVCVHSDEDEKGCGYGVSCKQCGAAEAIEACAQTGERQVKECRIHTKNNRRFDMLASAGVFEMANEKFILFILKDITAQRKTEAYEKMLFQKIIRSAGGLLSMSSYLADKFADSSLSENDRFIIRSIQETAEDLNSVTGELEELKQAEEGLMLTIPEPVSTAEVIKETVKLQKKKDRDAASFLIPKDSKDMVLVTDKEKLVKVLSCLLENAAEESAGLSPVYIGSYFEDEKVIFEVRNEGEMPDEIKSRVFEKFYTNKEGKNGFGCYIAKLFCEEYLSGSIDVHSGSGQTTVRISLPNVL